MYVANTHLKPVIGIDIHFVNLPFPFVPMPHPYIGLVIDPFDYIPFIGATVKVNHVPRGNTDTAGMIITFVHIPFGAGFTLVPIIGHDSQNFFGSKRVSIDGAPMSGAGYMLMTCNDIGIPLSIKPGKKFKPIPSLYLPTSFCIPLQWGKPVLVGGPLVPNFSLMALLKAFVFGSFLKIAGKIGGKLLTALNKKVLKKFPATQKLSSKCCKMGFEPVDLITGRVMYEYTDFELPGPIPLQWKRVWDSDSHIEGPLGHGVQWCYHRCIQLWPEDGCLSLTMADGRVAAFPVLYHGESYYHPREKIWLHRKQNGHFLLEDHTEGLYYHFNYDQQPGAWHLSFIENYSGHRIQFHYNGLHCNAITDSAGRRLFLTLDKQHRITQVRVQHRGMEQLLVSYAYNEAGDLVQITDALNQPVLIEYHHHLMIKKTDRNGQCFYWEYDTHNRCVHTWGNGGILEGRIAYHRGYNEVTNSLGETTTYYYDEFNLCIQETDHYGNNRYTEYTDNFDVYREIDEEGNITGYAYDQQARLTEKTLPDGSTMQFSYNEYNQPTLIIHPDGNSETYGYDALHRIQFINYPNGKTVTYEYNDEGQLEAVIETGNRKTVLTWDEDENLAGMQWTDGAVAHWKYDALGRCIQTINTTGEVRYFEYDPLSRLSHAYLPDGNLVTLAYNAYKEVIQATDRHNTIHYEYTPLGSLKKQTRNNRVLELLYDTEERLRTVVNEAGRHYVFGYNKRGEVISETGFGGLQKQYQRDATGKVIKALRPGGRFTQYEYDANGRITRVEYDDGSWEGYLYDKNGELLEAINEYSRVQFTRNKQGYVETEQQDGYLVHSVYSKSGERMQVTSNLGANIQLQRNKQGKVTNMQATQHNLLWEAQMKYNQAGQEIERILPGSLCSEWQYDRAGRPGEHKVVQRGVVQSWKKYTWDVNDRLVNVFDALSRGNTQFRHDALGNLVFAQYADNSIVHRAMDATGNIYETAGRNERRYNSAGALLESEWFIYKYDEEGNLLSKTNKATRQQTTYEWYANGRLKQVTRADGKKVTFTYDALGRRISKCFAGKITRWVWDGDRPLHEWSYNEKDKPQAVVNEWGEITYNKPEPNPHNALDEVAGITWVFDAESHRLAAKIVKGATYSVINDHTGAPQWMYDAAGKKVWEGVLDIYGRIRSLYGHAGDMPFRYPGQYEDAETGLYYNRFRYYDPASGAYISQDPVGLLGGMRLYSYVPDTNTWVDIFGLAGTGKAWLNYAKQYHDKRADEIFGEGKGRSVGGRNYDKFHEGKDIEYKSDNFSKGPRAEDSLKRMNTQIDKDIANKLAGDADPHWHFEHDPSVAEEMKPLLKKMDDNGITRTHGKTFPGFPGCN